jgi:hypothetical protein
VLNSIKHRKGFTAMKEYTAKCIDLNTNQIFYIKTKAMNITQADLFFSEMAKGGSFEIMAIANGMKEEF